MISIGPFYIVVCSSAKGTYVAERDVAVSTYAGTIDDIVSMQFDNLCQVLEIGSGRDVTEQMVRAAMMEWAHRGEPLTEGQYALVELHIGVHAARSFRRAA